MEYNPNKRYMWNRDDKFEISGEELGTIMFALRGLLNTEQATVILNANKAVEKMDSILARYVDVGTVKEVPDNVKP